MQHDHVGIDLGQNLNDAPGVKAPVPADTVMDIVRCKPHRRDGHQRTPGRGGEVRHELDHPLWREPVLQRGPAPGGRQDEQCGDNREKRNQAHPAGR
jgi:hypothetical protein